MNPTPLLAGIAIALASALAAEVCWQVMRPRTFQQFSVCWIGAILVRVTVALVGLAICIGLFHLAAPPVVISMTLGYVVVLAFETRVTLKRMRKMHAAERALKTD
jgi:hypothetical protein